MKKQTINHLAVILIVVLAQIIPVIWYGMFSDSWMEYNELTQAEIEENQSVVPYIARIFGTLFLVYTLAYVFVKMEVDSAQSGLSLALAMGFSFFAFPTLVQGLFSLKPIFLGIIDGGVYLIIWGVAGLILGGWRKYQLESDS